MVGSPAAFCVPCLSTGRIGTLVMVAPEGWYAFALWGWSVVCRYLL